jgi:hypothetical protein
MHLRLAHGRYANLVVLGVFCAMWFSQTPLEPELQALLSGAVSQVTDSLFEIWRWALERKLSLGPDKRANLNVVLVVPDTFSTWEIKEMVGVVLQQLGFASVVVHQAGALREFVHDELASTEAAP